ncbi:MAG: arylsulfatase [Lentisphaerae bacterium]|jgi:arylsulfatase A-like enzyme|nr:arylsulfatase [Lentisphaerota bacterium]MBT4821740.1 arylsulfatase [Lentisphaerota bacterium]MBT5604697.1 arylsulfatase [Lentisphaerota bacterium]MBT7055118.1 arylsulfatase [Lentisphaerota bacterium]MBT7846290.1 arylsulfatase [Lentisphaerota bacterium]
MADVRRPNVVLVLTDDQGYPPLGCNGHPFIQTPNLDAFHGRSVHFEQFHSGTTCAPTRSGLMTGHYCNSTGVWHTIGGRSLLRRNEWTLADALQTAGYATGMFGKWHLGDDYPYRPQDRGFQTVVCHGGGGISQGPDWWGNDYFDDTYLVNGEPRAFDGYCTDVFFREALSFIEDHRDEPFLCYIGTNAPHGPYNVEPEYQGLYTDQAERENYARFLGMITNIDENFGTLRAKLAELGLENDTILMFMSDNGQCGGAAGREPGVYNAGMRGFKGSEYDGGHRIPFFMRWPAGGIEEGQPVEELTSYVDFMPTILDLCGVPVPPERTFHGDSVTSLIHGDSSDPKWRERVVVTDTQRVSNPIKWRKSSVMKDTWRLVNHDELYDLSVDPGQTTNVADQHPELVAELREAYEEWWDVCAEQMAEEIPISIGAADQEVAVLRTHDIRNDDCDAVWNQQQIRGGATCLGWWEVFVEEDGVYGFDLRRWPVESGHALKDGIDGDDVVFRRDAIAEHAHASYTGGKAINLQNALLEISGIPQMSTAISDGDVGATFEVELKRGPIHVRGYLTNYEGLMMSPYYVYVKKVG